MRTVGGGCFAVAVIAQHQMREIRAHPLVAEIADITTATDDDGVSHFVVSGHVQNRSDQIYGVPGLIIISYDVNNNIVDRQRFLPSATLLDAGGAVNFSHTLSVPVGTVDRIAVELENQGG